MVVIMEQIDIYIKDEGDFVSVFLITEKAQHVADEERLQCTIDKGNQRIDVMNSQINKIITFANDNNLTINSEIDLTTLEYE